MDCLFCRIAKREIPSEIIYDDAATVAFLDIHPRAIGHAVIIPRDHVENILDLPDQKIAPVFLTVKKVSAILNKALNPSGFTIGINHGKVSGQMIDHLHVHIIPRFDNDGGHSLHSVVDCPPQEDVASVARRIRGEVPSD